MRDMQVVILDVRNLLVAYATVPQGASKMYNSYLSSHYGILMGGWRPDERKNVLKSNLGEWRHGQPC